MAASVPKRVDLFKSPLTARAGPYMYLWAADNGSGRGRSRSGGTNTMVMAYG
jgi:hypothetical protein